jgi:TolB protein
MLVRLICLLLLGLVLYRQAESGTRRLEAAVSHSDIGRIAFGANRAGKWNLYTIRADGTDLRQVTSGPGEDRSPAWSPDGKRLAFQSRRDGNWDVYVLNVGEQVPLRLTADPSYDGAPTWSPDGSRLAFDSYRSGDLDIFVMNADGSEQTNLTPTDPAGDFDPTWSPDGNRIAFTSWRMGDNDLFTMDMKTKAVTQWTDAATPEGSAAWSRDGRSLAYVEDQADRQEIRLGSASQPIVKGATSYRLTWYSRDDSPALSPDGSRLAFISHQHLADRDQDFLLLQDLGAVRDSKASFSLPEVLLEDWEISGPISWTDHDEPWGEPVQPYSATHKIFSPDVAAKQAHPVSGSTQGPTAFVDLTDVKAPNARLNPVVVDSFKTVRTAIHNATGYDFLSELSDMWRGIDAAVDSNRMSAYLSYHKTGRAFDSLFDYRDSSNLPVLEVVREDIGGQTYWRLFMKAAMQDGSVGSPLKTQPWDLSGRARRKFPNDGGSWKAIPYGYYVDVSDIFRDAGWERISSIDREEFSWRWNFMALEYWHHQFRNGLTWYEAMTEMYPTPDVDELYSWRSLIREGEKPYNLFLDGIPVPADLGRWREVRP